jgi:nitrate reductase NapE component
MLVAIVGDGRHELIKHLFMANLLFDSALLAFVGSFLAWIFGARAGRSAL